MKSPIIFHRCCQTSVKHIAKLSSNSFQEHIHTSAVEKPTKIKQKKTSNVAKSKELDEKMYLQNVNPTDFKLLVNTFQHGSGRKFFPKNKEISLYEHLRQYRKHYLEKKIVGDPFTASEIVSCILQNSQGDQKTPFIDADGGICLIARSMSLNNTTSRPIQIFDRNDIFSSLHTNWFSKNDNGKKISVQSLNMFSYLSAADEDQELSNFEMELLKFRNNDWNQPTPAFTLFSTSSQLNIKYLAMKCLDVWTSKPEQSGFFRHTRPEFFFLVWPKTTDYFMKPLSKKNKNLKTYRAANVVFRILFDCEKVGCFPMKAMVPWSDKNDVENIDLIKFRPKQEVDFRAGDDCFEKYEFEYFLHLLEMPRGRKLIALMEEYFPNSDIGLDMILNFGLKTKNKTKELEIEKIVPLFKLLMSQPDYNLSYFKMSADLYRFDRHKKAAMQTKSQPQLSQLKHL